jgi:recombination protein RecT
VRPGDEFEYQLGDTPFCKHKPGDEDDDALFTYVYAIGRVRDSEMPVIEVWTRAKVLKHLKKYNKVGGKHYAAGDEHNLEMYARKIALLQVLKYMPSSVELANAIVASHAAEEGREVTIENGIIIETGEALPEENGGRSELPECTAEKFEKKTKEWRDQIIGKKKTVAELIAVIETKDKLTDAQKMTIDAWAHEND